MIKRNRILYWIATLWLSLGMVATAIVQLLRQEEGSGGLDSIMKLGYPVYILPILGVWKILGVVAVLLPKLPLIKEWAYAGFFFLISGAIFSHLIVKDNPKELFGPTLLLVLTVISWYLRPPGRKIITFSS